MLELSTRRSPAPLSKHAAVRSQQRSLPPSVINALIDFGDTDHDGKGAVRHSFSKHSWRKYLNYPGKEAKYYEGYRSAYVVVAENGLVITVGWRH